MQKVWERSIRKLQMQLFSHSDVVRSIKAASLMGVVRCCRMCALLDLYPHPTVMSPSCTLLHRCSKVISKSFYKHITIVPKHFHAEELFSPKYLMFLWQRYCLNILACNISTFNVWFHLAGLSLYWLVYNQPRQAWDCFFFRWISQSNP